MTDDAVPADEHPIGHLVDASRQWGPQGKSVTVAYIRQLPDKDRPVVERYARSFNYLGESRIKTKEDPERMGIKIFFASNVCCAYDHERFWFQGGFTIKAIFNEDMISASRTVL